MKKIVRIMTVRSCVEYCPHCSLLNNGDRYCDKSKRLMDVVKHTYTMNQDAIPDWCELEDAD